VLPEFSLYAALQDLPEELGRGKYAEGSREEPVLSTFTGLSPELIDDVFLALQQKPPHLSLDFPRSPAHLPIISIKPEAMAPAGQMMGHHGGYEDEDTTEVTTDTVLTPTGGAVGGETTFQLPERHIIPGSLTLTVTTGGVETSLFPVYNEFTLVGESGVITLATALSAGDILTATGYSYYGLPGGDIYSTLFDFTHVIFVDSLNPLVTGVLVGLVWRELVTKQLDLHTAGLSDLEFSRRSLSLWEDREPPLGFRSEIAVTGITEWKAYVRAPSPRVLEVDMDTTDGENDSILQMTMELGALSISPFDNE
jgi:hypothetical protein